MSYSAILTFRNPLLKILDPAGPDMARIVSEVNIKQCKDPKNSHHEQTPSTQNMQVCKKCEECVINIFNEWGNPFTETSSNSFAVDTNVLMTIKLFKV